MGSGPGFQHQYARDASPGLSRSQITAGYVTRRSIDEPADLSVAWNGYRAGETNLCD
jgi:hypothetical protein